ncbi:MAG: carbohydrate-binding protein [Hungatella sp.]|jgi:chitinase|nr:carbohydrate-binding protein [Hungatella sp.]
MKRTRKKNALLSAVLILALGTSSYATIPVCAVGNENAVEYTKDSGRLKNVMYYGDWSIWGGQGNFYPKGIPMDQLTHLNFAFLDFDSNGELVFTDKDAAVGAPVGMEGAQWDAPGSGILSALQDLRAQYPNVRLGVSIGGWSKSGDFSTVAANPAVRQNFVNNVMKFIRYTNMDFVDLDWEYPTSVRQPDLVDNKNDEGTPFAIPADKQNYITLLQDLRDALDEQGNELDRVYELSVALPASRTLLEAGVDIPALFNIVDFANIMTYDLHGAWDTFSSHHTGLYTNPNDPTEGEGLSVDASVQYLLSEGALANKIVVGVAFYTRGWEQVLNDGPDQNLPGLFGSAQQVTKDADQTPSKGAKNETALASGDGGRRSGVWSYRNLDSLKTAYPGLTEYWDDYAKAPYLYNEQTGAFFTYDNIQSIQEKTAYVKDNNLGGNISWMASQDAEKSTGKRDKLTSAIKEGLFGHAQLPEYTLSEPELNLTATISTYNDYGTKGYEITITNNETSDESNAVLAATELSYETVKNPRVYISTYSGAVLSSGGYGSGSVTMKDGVAIADLSNVYAYKTLKQGDTATFKISTNGIADINDIKSIEISQRIVSSSAEISRQKIYEGTGAMNPGTEPATEPETVPPTEPVTEPETVPPTEPETVPPTEPESDIDTGTISEYSPEAIYVQGDLVMYQGNIYQAKWWTQGNIPGTEQWGPWELVQQ